jgi:beta-lactamase regulating signal transducer with metallopeptidase domain
MNIQWVWDWHTVAGATVLADAAVKGTVLLGLAWGVTAALRRGSAAVRHWVWMTAFAGLLVLPVLGVALPGWAVLPKWMGIRGAASPRGVSAESVQTVAYAMPGPLGVPEARAEIQSGPRLTVSGPWAVVVVWGAGALGMLVPVALGAMWLRRLRRTGTEVMDPEWRELLRRLAAMSGVTRKVELRRSERCAVPLTYGVWRPVIVLPAEATDWTAERRRMALLHELAHIQRWDFLTQMLARCVRAVYWFHPLAWVAVARGQAESERACDDRVLTAGTKSSTYANTLMEYAAPLMRGGTSAGRRCHVPVGALAMARPSTLEGRLLAILDAACDRRGVTWRSGVAILAVVAGLSAGLGMLRAQTPGTQPAPRAAEVGGTRRLELRPDTVMPETWGGTGRTTAGRGAATTQAGAAGTTPGKMAIEYMPLRTAKASDVAKLVNAMFNPAGTERPKEGQQRLYADADERTNTVVLSGPADQVKQAREMIEKADQPPDLPPTNVFFIAHLKAAQAADVAAKVNAHFTTTKPGASTGPARGREGGPQINELEPHCAANAETNSVLVSCDVSNEDAVKAYIKALDEAAASSTKPADAMP